jgi:hypothetical protein
LFIYINMPSQEQIEQGISIPLFAAEMNEGEAKSHNAYPNQIQRANITSRSYDDRYIIDCRLETCVHGTLDSVTKSPASLMILGFRLDCLEENHNFTSAKIALQFAPCSTTDRIEIIGIAPESKLWNPSVGSRGHAARFMAKAGSSIPLVALALEGEINSSTQCEKTFYNEVQAGRTKDDTTVYWYLKQNPGLENGVPRSFKLALLLKHVEHAPFQAKFDIEIQGCRHYKAKELAYRFRRRSDVEDDPINFNPSAPPKSLPQGVNSQSLGMLLDEPLLRQLDRSWGLDPEDWKLGGSTC